MSLILLCGCSFAIDFRLPFLIPLLPFLPSIFVPNKKKGGGLLFLASFLLGFGMVSLRYSFPKGDKAWVGKGLFIIDTFQKGSSPFQEFWRYDGTFKWFRSDQTFRNVPCSIVLPIAKRPFDPNCSYLLEGTLIPKPNHHFSFKPKKGTLWKGTPHGFPITHLRFKAKNALKHYLKERVPHPASHQLLSALATGEVDDRMLGLDFGTLGLQHLLAISGFHFGLLALALSWLLKLFLSPRCAALLIIPLISFYFLFLGSSPSCFRAWMTISLFFAAHIFSRRSSGLNLIGISLIASLLINPLVVNHLGFQLSYLTTLAILLYFPLCEILLFPLLPPRPFPQLLNMPCLHQHGYILSALFRSELALNIAVHLFAIPALLFLFGKYPLLSLLYNLFIPLLVGGSLLLLIAALIASPIPHLCQTIHLINSTYTSWILTLTSHPPLAFHFFLYWGSIPLWGVISFLTLCFWVGLALKGRLAPEKLTESPF